MRIDYQKASPALANHPHPVDDGLLDLHSTRRNIIRLFMRDGELCPAEQQVLQMFDEGLGEIAAYRTRERFAEHYARSGNVTRYTTQLAEDAGLHIVPAQEERGRIVRFPGLDENEIG